MNFDTHEKKTTPYLFYEFDDCFLPETIQEINSIVALLDGKIDISRYNSRRDANIDRFFLTKDNISDYPALKTAIDYLRSKETVNKIEQFGNISLTECYLRFEIILDKETFWLEKHTDIIEKKMSCLVFINDNNEPEENGTDLYNDKLEHVYTVPFRHNHGYMFFPSTNTWHGLEKGKPIKYRKAVLINYVTFPTDFALKGDLRHGL